VRNISRSKSRLLKNIPRDQVLEAFVGQKHRTAKGLLEDDQTSVREISETLMAGVSGCVRSFHIAKNSMSRNKSTCGDHYVGGSI